MDKNKINKNTKPVMAKEKKGSELLWRQEDEKFILLARHDIYVLNEYSKEILELCSGDNTIEDIVKKIQIKYKLDENETLNEIVDFIEYVVEKDLVLVENAND